MIHKCCCCIPLRAGVIIIATLLLLADIVSIVYMALQKQDIAQYLSTATSSVDAYFIVFMVISAIGILAASLGLLGAIMQKRALVNFFKVFYWTVAILTFVATVATWIVLLMKRDEISAYCTAYLDSSSSSGSAGAISSGMAADACDTSLRGLLIGGAIGVVLGNMISIYFACVISSYSSRLKRSNQHHPLRDLEDFPQTSYKTSVY